MKAIRGILFTVLLAVVFAALAVFQISTKKVDEIALALIGLTCLPLLLPYIRSIELPTGIKVELLERKVQRQEAKIEEQQNIINELVVYSMAFYLYEMMQNFYECELGNMTEYTYDRQPKSEAHLRYLRDHGYLEMSFNIADLVKDENIAQKVKLTPVGRFYVETRRKYEAQNIGRSSKVKS